MKWNYFRYLTILLGALAIVSVAPAFGSDELQSKHHVSKRQAEQIALAKIRGGSIRAVEFQTDKGSRFWSVYVLKPGSKNAKEVRIDAATGKILNVQTERPEDQAEEPAATR